MALEVCYFGTLSAAGLTWGVEVEMAEEKPKEVFVISPIDADRSEVRMRSDKVLEFIIRHSQSRILS